MAPLVNLIAASVDDGGIDLVESAVFGTADAAEITYALERKVVSTLGTDVEEALFYETSVGCVAGLLMQDGTKLVVKGYQPRWSNQFLRSVQRVQGALAGSGFPCPQPVAGPVDILGGHALIEAYLPDSGRRLITKSMMGVSAAGLANQIDSCRGLNASGLSPHPMDSATDHLYPVPHSPSFDFEASAAGAEWIDQLAQTSSACGVSSWPISAPNHNCHTQIPSAAHHLPFGTTWAPVDIGANSSSSCRRLRCHRPCVSSNTCSGWGSTVLRSRRLRRRRVGWRGRWRRRRG